MLSVNMLTLVSRQVSMVNCKNEELVWIVDSSRMPGVHHCADEVIIIGKAPVHYIHKQDAQRQINDAKSGISCYLASDPKM